MPCGREIVDGSAPAEICEEAPGLVHDQVGRRYIPIVRIGRGKTGLDLTRTDECQSVGERRNFGLGKKFQSAPAQMIEHGHRPSDPATRKALRGRDARRYAVELGAAPGNRCVSAP
ncbi:MAG: hypothetical protein JWL62_3719, partial [Hyphomicrobiales bacterium]|nr:hypothetical protein [Hyphomicrobiales bacterium]